MKKLTVDQIALMLNKTRQEVNQMTFSEIDKAIGCQVQIVNTPVFQGWD